ncbi:MAG: FxsA family protein [Paracoccaceae bacterium]
MWLFIIFVTIPIIEIALFIQVGGWIGLWPTLGIVILTAVLGTWLMREQGLRALQDLKTSMNELRDPTEPLAHGAMILFAGALLLTPGFFTDMVGLLLLIPPVRSAVYSYLRSRVKVQSFTVHGGRQPSGADTDTITDVEYEEIEPETPKKPGESGWTRH